MKIYELVLTGGPCGGKTSGLARIEQELTDRGYKVLIADESATRLMTSGLSFTELGSKLFQKYIIKNQLNTEELLVDVAESLEYINHTCKGVIIIYDRGIVDGLAFLDKSIFEELLRYEGITLPESRDKYDAVFHLTTCAKGAEQYYTLENNKTRSEGLEMAREVDTKLVNAWVGHPHLRIIPNNTDSFKSKMDNLMQEIYSFLGEPVPMEIERKYLIEKPNLSKLEEMYECTRVEIIQTYLNELSVGVERRVRQRGCSGSYTYYYTEKSKADENGLCRAEEERKISRDEYVTLLMDADTSRHQIRKDRYCFMYENQYFELDVYPFWSNNAILEIELTDVANEVELPNFLTILNDVTCDSRFKNKNLAKDFNILN